MAASERYSLLLQQPGRDGTLHDRIAYWLTRNELKRFRIAVAFARWDGVGLIAGRIEELLQRGGKFDALIGVANGVTTPDSLAYALYLDELYPNQIECGVVEDEYANSLFHPKLYVFEFPERCIALVGSGNLTGAGLLNNTEMECEITAELGSKESKSLSAIWKLLRARAQTADRKLIKELWNSGKLASERGRGELPNKAEGKPSIKRKHRLAPKPLLAKILGEQPKGKSKKYKALAKMDAVTERPKRLYLQILKYETGGAKGGTESGVQIQLPTATLAAYFGVGSNEKRKVRFRFPGLVDDQTLMHFKNKTHRVRLKALLGAPRPTIVTFDRLVEDDYKCAIVPQNSYRSTLKRRCTEQTRAGARRWGFTQ